MKRKYGLLQTIVLVCCVIIVCSGCAGSDYEDVTSMSAGYQLEVPVVEADSVSVPAKAVKEIQKLQRELYNKLIVFSDQKLINALRHQAREIIGIVWNNIRRERNVVTRLFRYIIVLEKKFKKCLTFR